MQIGDYALAPFDDVSGAPCRIHEVVRDGDADEPVPTANVTPAPVCGFLVRFVEDGVDAPRVFVAVDDLQVRELQDAYMSWIQPSKK